MTRCDCGRRPDCACGDLWQRPPQTCGTCGYPHDQDACPNPACDACPDVSDAAKAARRARHDQAVAEEAERERIRTIRRRHR